MAALPAGVQYGLSSESSFKEDKELVFVKLTDSAYKAIEDFIKNLNKDNVATPTIQILRGSEGKITIPNGTASESTFHFSINSNAEMEGPQGSFECVRSNGAKRLESCGPLPRRMRVLANDDSYEITKDRMARTVAAEQSKCTRVIKPNQNDIGRRVKVRSAHQYSSSSVPPHHVPDRMERVERLERPDRLERPVKQDRPDRPEREKPERVERPERTDRPPGSAVPPRPVPAQPVHQPMNNQPPRPPTNPDLSRRSIKERLIQLLALKPFKKPELYSRLNSEGIKDKDKGLVNKILPSIGTLKDNCYHLKRHIWNDVNEEWPFYSEEEKRILKRRKPQNLTPPLSSDSTNSLSPRASPSANKRPSSSASVTEEAPASKKQRISHYKRPDQRTGSPSSGYATGSSGASSGERHASDNEDDRNVKKDNGYTLSYNTLKDLSASPAKNGYRSSPPQEPTAVKTNGYRTSPTQEQPVPKPNSYRHSPPVEQSETNGYKNSPREEQNSMKVNGYRNSPPVEQHVAKTNGYRNSPISEQNSTKMNGYNHSPPIEQSSNSEIITNSLDNTDITLSTAAEEASDLKEIQKQYPPITGSGQRRAYKNEFSHLYTEYRELYSRVARVAEMFTRLEKQLKCAKPHSPNRQNIELKIIEEYKRLRNDATYQKERRRVNYLHLKLNHLKRCVQQYDQLRNLKPERVSTASTTQAY